MIVVDTNVIAALYLKTEKSTLAEKALQNDPEWIAPVLWRSELQNVLVLQVRQRHLALSDALQVMAAAEAQFEEHEFQVASRDVLSLAASSGCSAYDCEFVALAQTLSVLLITLDRKVQTAFPDIAVGLEHFAG